MSLSEKQLEDALGALICESEFYSLGLLKVQPQSVEDRVLAILELRKARVILLTASGVVTPGAAPEAAPAGVSAPTDAMDAIDRLSLACGQRAEGRSDSERLTNLLTNAGYFDAVNAEKPQSVLEAAKIGAAKMGFDIGF